MEETEEELSMSQRLQQKTGSKGHGNQAILCLIGKEKEAILRAGEPSGGFK